MAKKILLVDDEIDLVKVTISRLENYGYEVVHVNDSTGTFAQLSKDSPDLILLDLLLPGVQGEDICKQLKADDRYKKIPIVLFTASASNLPTLSTTIGADDFILKPYDPEDLLQKIKKFIG